MGDPDEQEPRSMSFAEAFGVSEEELRRQGIDPVDYARHRGASIERSSRSFSDVFGISEDELRRKGIDPLDFARERGALVRRGLGRLEPDDEKLWDRWRTWSLRFYAAAFVALGLLAVAYAFRHHDSLRIAFKTLAAIVGGTGIAMGQYGFVCWIRYVRARRRAGLSWRR
jgi:hypothetical protein